MEAVRNMETSAPLVERKRGVIGTLLGQFATRDFWKNLFSLVVKEAISSFILSLGGTLIYYIKGKTNTDGQTIRNISHGAQPSAPANAFSNGYTPRPSYNPPAPAAQPSFPGFGS